MGSLWRPDIGRKYTVLNEKVLFASEGNENTARRFRVDVTNQRGLAGADRSLLLWAVAAPVNDELIGVHDSIQLAREA